MSFPRYSAYKDSGVEWLGEVPVDWNAKRLRHISQINPPRSETHSLSDDTLVSFVPMEAIGEDGSLQVSELRALGDIGGGYTYFRDGDVLVAKITPCFENGKGALCQNLHNNIGLGTTELHVLRSGYTLEASFLFYLTRSPGFHEQGQAAMYGAAGQLRVPADFIRDFVAPLPPLPEQRAMAAFLDAETARIDTLLAKQAALIALLQEKRRALISHAVTKGLDPAAPMKDSGVAWLGAVPAHWEVKRFRHCCDIAEGQIDPKDERFNERLLIAPNHIESGTGRILYTETAAEQGAISGKYLVKPGEIIYSKIRPALNKVCIAEGHWLCSADMYPFQVRDVLSAQFFFFFLLSDPFVRLMVEESMRVAMPKVNRETLTDCPIPIPPRSEQEAIAEHIALEIAEIDTLIAKTQHFIALLRERRSALIAAAVTGQIDVRGGCEESLYSLSCSVGTRSSQ